MDYVSQGTAPSYRGWLLPRRLVGLFRNLTCTGLNFLKLCYRITRYDHVTGSERNDVIMAYSSCTLSF